MGPLVLLVFPRPCSLTNSAQCHYGPHSKVGEAGAVLTGLTALVAARPATWPTAGAGLEDVMSTDNELQLAQRLIKVVPPTTYLVYRLIRPPTTYRVY